MQDPLNCSHFTTRSISTTSTKISDLLEMSKNTPSLHTALEIGKVSNKMSSVTFFGHKHTLSRGG